MADHNTAHTAPLFNDALHEEFLTEKQLAARHRRSPKTLRNDRVLGVYVPFHLVYLVSAVADAGAPARKRQVATPMIPVSIGVRVWLATAHTGMGGSFDGWC